MSQENKTFSEVVIKNLKREKYFSRHACKSNKGQRRVQEAVSDKTNLRPTFFHDSDKIMHSSAYSRYMDKTQVFSLFENDHITHRALHVQFVSKIGRDIGRCLGLNEDLIEAIAVGHDLGHPPYGHDGEQILNSICQKNDIGTFCHSAQSVRWLMDLEFEGKGLNLTLQVLDGILAHNGEMLSRKYEPVLKKTWEDFLDEYQKCLRINDYYKKLFPMTLEGCVVRISDVIAYIGRDIEDAITIKLVERKDIPKQIAKTLGDANDQIIHRLVLDLIHNSYDKPFLSFSQNVFTALNQLKKFNYKSIYNNSKIKTQNQKINNMFEQLFTAYCEHIKNNNQKSAVYQYFLKHMPSTYANSTPLERKVIDFISGMTDDFFNNQFQQLFVPTSYGYEVRG
jgi:dGTPase